MSKGRRACGEVVSGKAWHVEPLFDFAKSLLQLAWALAFSGLAWGVTLKIRQVMGRKTSCGSYKGLFLRWL